MFTTAQFILNRLTEWGVKRVYGYPGDGINGLIGAFHEVGDKLDLVQTRHEEIASFAACAHAKFTGEVGVCMATSGLGAIHLLNGVYDAKLDHQPVVAIIGQQKRMSLGANYQQEVDLNTLYKDVASEYLMTIMDPTQARYVIDRAMRIARDSRHPAAVIVPEDVHQEPPRAHGAVFSSLGFSRPLIPGDLGAAGDGRRPEAGLAGAARLPVRPLRGGAGAEADPGRAAGGCRTGLVPRPLRGSPGSRPRRRRATGCPANGGAGVARGKLRRSDGLGWVELGCVFLQLGIQQGGGANP